LRNTKHALFSYLLFNIGPTITDILFAIVFFVFTFNILFGALVLVTMILYMGKCRIITYKTHTFSGLTLYVTQWRIKFRRAMNAADNNAGAIAMDSLLNYETVKYYGNESLEYKRYKEALAE
jgi:ABC-type transport system involved in Fe-S cluster assembly fused permease/ATPase subunit